MAIFPVQAPFMIQVSFTNIHLPYRCRFSLQKYKSTKVDFTSYSVFRAFPVLQLLKHNQLKIILTSKRHILRWPIHSVPLHSQQLICLTDNLGKAWKPKWQSRRKTGGKTPDHWDKHPIPCHRAHIVNSLPHLVQLSLILLLQLHFQFSLKSRGNGVLGQDQGDESEALALLQNSRFMKKQNLSNQVTL